MEQYMNIQDLQSRKLDLIRQLQTSEDSDESQRLMDLIEHFNERIIELLNCSSNPHIPAYD